MEIHVRPPELRDVPAIARIHVAAWEGTFRGLLDDEVLDERTDEVRQRMWTRRIAEPEPGEVNVVGELDGEVRGFAYGAPGHYEDEDPERIINFNAIFIDLDLKGAGFAAAVHRGFLEECARQGYERVSGQIHPENKASLKFILEKMGWYRDGFERDVAGQTEWRVQRPLDDIRAELGLD